EQLHKHKFPYQVLCYDSDKKKVCYDKIVHTEMETRLNYWILSTYKRNRIIISSDQLVFCNQSWLIPEEMKVSDEVWINKGRGIMSDMIIDITQFHSSYNVYH